MSKSDLMQDVVKITSKCSTMQRWTLYLKRLVRREGLRWGKLLKSVLALPITSRHFNRISSSSQGLPERALPRWDTKILLGPSKLEDKIWASSITMSRERVSWILSGLISGNGNWRRPLNLSNINFAEEQKQEEAIKRHDQHKHKPQYTGLSQ